MRSIRRAAIAGATAATLILGAATAATAEEGPKKDDNALSSFLKKEENKDKKKGENALDSTSASLNKSVAGSTKSLELDQPANGDRVFGSDTNAGKAPKWAQYMKIVTIVGLIGSFLGLVAFPAYNFAVANHLLPGQPR